MKRFAIVVSLFVALNGFAAERFIARFKTAVPAGLATQVTAAGGTVVWSHASSGLAVIEGVTAADAASIAKKTRAAEMVADVSWSLAPARAESRFFTGVRPASAADPSLALAFPLQWHLRAIGADAAWAAGRLGSDDVTVAVIDSGIDYLHPDLAGRVDLSRSVSFVPEDEDVVDSLFPGRNYVTDLFYHGTHVASTIVSNGGNSAAVTSNVTLIAVKVVNAWGSGSLGATLAGVLWAADHGADVANMSLGELFAKPGAGRLVAVVNQVLNYAHRKGTLLVVSAGNDAADLDHDGNALPLFCGTPNVLCVSATGPVQADGEYGPWYEVDAPAYYTNYGRSAVGVAAPGGTWGWWGWAPVWAACSMTTIWEPLCQASPLVVGGVGTSMAAPHVTGLAALLVEDLGKNPSRIKARIQSTADDLGEPGVDPYYGKGRINVPRALGLQ